MRLEYFERLLELSPRKLSFGNYRPPTPFSLLEACGHSSALFGVGNFVLKKHTELPALILDLLFSVPHKGEENVEEVLLKCLPYSLHPKHIHLVWEIHFNFLPLL